MFNVKLSVLLVSQTATLSSSSASDQVPFLMCIMCDFYCMCLTTLPVIPLCSPCVFVLTQSCRWQHSPRGHERLDSFQRYTYTLRLAPLWPAKLFPVPLKYTL